ncbi:PhzF family phenazine biosynthesis protein [Nitratireductor sp. L1-7-SE]|uniref:PhzF family phenazine biosynthesis protein n=1 Tax=Nitratireductor rhodophyticola TaxID=2854036 RepID=A0ABS7R449_9HYPH|nr:PhzF family phenazine biosynthesis protein [Nitratireductor rhodophyticola]MBY8915706.1 PhzF family phenazine biosynthesis protein [Nitratireductor rhodophyticola]MBY8919225.1 PhzF family phenazine biosynthesis protein [Nitratireductor rhodophyticola]
MTGRNYYIYDVFSDEALAGNPLAIVLDAEGLDDTAMQRIAGEFNLSETVFVLPAEHDNHTARLRIFTPRTELPFAGHPTVGTAIALAERAGTGGDGIRTSILMLEEAVGAVRCAVTVGKNAAYAEFDLPRLPVSLPIPIEPEAVAAALGLGHHEIGFENHAISTWSAGVPYVCVPVADLDVARRARIDAALWRSLLPELEGPAAAPYIYCRETVNHDHAFHVRMFAPDDGIAEDPATGSAAAAFAGAIMQHDALVDGSHGLLIEQGIEMGRPSSIRLEIDVHGGAVESARIGGHAIRVAEGRLLI